MPDDYIDGGYGPGKDFKYRTPNPYSVDPRTGRVIDPAAPQNKLVDPTIGYIPGVGEWIRGAEYDPQLGFDNWLSGLNMAPGARKLIMSLFPQLLNRYKLARTKAYDRPSSPMTVQGGAPGTVQSNYYNTDIGMTPGDKLRQVGGWETFLGREDPFALIREFLPMLYGSGEGMLGGRPQAGRRRVF